MVHKSIINMSFLTYSHQLYIVWTFPIIIYKYNTFETTVLLKFLKYSFVCFVALRPKSTAMVIAGRVSKI